MAHKSSIAPFQSALTEVSFNYKYLFLYTYVDFFKKIDRIQLL